MKRFIQKSLIAAISVGIAGVSIQAHATNGYFAHGYGTKAKGMAGAGVAYPQDSLAAATNPAGMVWIGNRWDLGAEVFAPDRTATTAWGNTAIDPDTGAYDPANARTYDGNGNGFGESWFLIPEFGYNHMINNDLSLGVSVFGNGGMNTTWNGPIYSEGTTGIDTAIDLAQLFISPTVSWKVNKNHSIGLAVNLIYQRIKLEGISDFCGFTPGGNPEGCFDGPQTGLSDQGYSGSTGAGVRLGWLGKFDNGVSVGASWQSRSRMSRFKKYDQLFAENGDFDIPSTWTLGVAFELMPKVNVAFDVQKINYTEINSVANPNTGWNDLFADGVLDNPLGSDAGPGFGWSDMTVYKLGFDYQYSKNLVMRAGWNHGSQPVSASEVQFNVLAPAVVEDHLTFGFTWTMQGGGELSGYFMHALEETVTGTSNSGAPGSAFNAGNGVIGMSQNAFGVTYGKDF